MDADEPLLARRYRELVLPKISRAPDPVAVAATAHRTLKSALLLAMLILPALASDLDYTPTKRKAPAPPRPVRAAQLDLPTAVFPSDDGTQEALSLAYAHRLPGRQETLLETLEPPGAFLGPSAWLVERVDKDLYRIRCGSYEFDVNLTAETVSIVPGTTALFAGGR